MGSSDPVLGISENMSAAKKRSLDTFLRDAERDHHKTPSKRPYCPDSLSSRVTDWLSQLPPESALEAGPDVEAESEVEVDPDAMKTFKKDKGKGKGKGDGSGAGGLATPSLASASGLSRPASPTGTAQTDQTGHSKATTSTGRLVERPEYRRLNLKHNEIHFLPRYIPKPPLPEYVSAVCDDIKKPRTSPEPTPEEVEREMLHLMKMQHEGATEAQVERWFQSRVFPDETMINDGLEVIPKSTFQHCIPNSSSEHKVSKPIPDLVYGYANNPGMTPFTDAQLIAGERMDPNMGGVDTHGVLSFPFFVIEYKGDGQVNGNPWVATNQCLGGSAVCTEAVNRLNSLLKNYPAARPVGNMAFSIAVSQCNAHLYVSWKSDELKYYTRMASVFCLELPEHFLDFRRHVKNILDWGKGPRLRDIQAAFDTILEEDRKIASDKAKQRSAPSTTSNGSNPKRLQFSLPGSSPPPASRASSSRTQSDRRDRPAPAPASNSFDPQVGYRSTSAASAASGSNSYQSGASVGSGGGGGGSRAGSEVGRVQDRNRRPSPQPPGGRSASIQSSPQAGRAMMSVDKRQYHQGLADQAPTPAVDLVRAQQAARI
ncbi:hypothetical protein PG995_010568 [Apiospora arundinis]